MTKKEIVNTISTEVDVPQVLVRQVVQRTFDSVIESLVQDGRIELRDFAVFEVVTRKGRQAHNPRTGQPVMVPDRLTVKFTPGKLMQEKVAEALSWDEETVSEDSEKLVGAIERR